jgi:carboxymethylenebutenolidase
MFDGKVASTIEEADQLSGSSDDKAIQAIVLATAEELANRLGPGAAVAAVGFSFGAAWALWAPTRSDRLGSTVVHYGTWTEAEVLSASRAPVLGHFAEDDPYETAETVEEFERLLGDAGRDAEIHRYPGTGHWFAEPSKDAYRQQAADLAFRRTVAFLNRHAAPAED